MTEHEMETEIRELLAKVRKLEGALRELSICHCVAGMHPPDIEGDTYCLTAKIAREALGEKLINIEELRRHWSADHECACDEAKSGLALLDEIKRLRAENEELWKDRSNSAQVIIAKDARIEKLEAALRFYSDDAG